MKEVLSESEVVARTMGVQLQLVEVRDPGELDGAFSAIAREHPDALVVLPAWSDLLRERRIVEFAATHRLPAMYFVEGVRGNRRSHLLWTELHRLVQA